MFGMVTMLILCSLIQGSTGQKVYTYMQSEVNTKSIQILHMVYLKLVKLK